MLYIFPTKPFKTSCVVTQRSRQNIPPPLQVTSVVGTESFQVDHHPRRRCGSSYSIRLPTLKSVNPSRSEDMADFHLRRQSWADFVLSPFDLYMGSRVTCVEASFLSIFSLLGPSILNLGSGTGQTTAINAKSPMHPMRAEYNNLMPRSTIANDHEGH